jgi:SAM-dependent methyltransferase
MIVFNFVKPLNPSDTENLSRIDERLHRVAKWFTKSINPELSVLTDRQKWAYAWLPQSHFVVDIGCSNRPLINLLQFKSTNVIGVDIDAGALKSLNNHNQNITLIQAKAENLPMQSNFADAVLLLDVLEHTQDDKMVISEAWRILKPGGLLILSVPYKGLFRFLDPENLSRKIKSKTNYPYHKHYSFTDLRRLFFRLFRFEHTHYGGLFLTPITFGLNNFCLKHFKLDLSKCLNKIGDIDFDLSWGRMSYNLIIKARKF